MNYWSKVLNGRVSRRRALSALGGGAAAAAFVAACGGDDDEDDEGGSEGSSSGGGAQEAVKRGGNLRIGTSADLVGTDPHVLGPTLWSLWLVTEGLTTYDQKIQPLPRLATSWELSNGGATTVFKLRQGVKYHTGREFTSDDVKWNIERVQNPSLPYAQFRTMATWFQTIETPDKYTVVFKSDAPRPAMFDFTMAFKMAEKDTVGGPVLVGTGPWKWAEWKQGQSMKWTKNPEYWDQGKPYLDEINWQMPMDQEAAIAHLESGALDAVLAPAITGYVRLQGNSKFQTMANPMPGTNWAMGIKVTTKPFDDKRVRQAINWAVDKKRLGEVVARKTIKTRSLPWNESSAAYEASKDQHYNLDLKKSADLLRAANVSNLTTGVTYSSAYGLMDFLPMWKEDLRTVGIDLRLDQVEPAAFPPIVNGWKHDSLWAARVGQGGGVPIAMFILGSGIWGGDGKNLMLYENAAHQALINKCGIEMDPQKQRQMYSQLNDWILDESHVIVAGPDAVTFAAASNVKGVKPTPHDSFDYTETWLA